MEFKKTIKKKEISETFEETKPSITRKQAALSFDYMPLYIDQAGALRHKNKSYGIFKYQKENYSLNFN